MKVDLYLGSDIGLWALQSVEDADIGTVITLDHSVAELAAKRQLRVIFDNANNADFPYQRTGISVHYPRILKPDIISKYEALYNLHPGYLPWGRGFYPVFWALWENSPAGATLHYIAPAVDAGPIVYQEEVHYSDIDTGYTLFERVRLIEKRIFLEYFQRIRSGEKLPAFEQEGSGSYHSKQEFSDIKSKVNLDELSARELVRLTRCLTFPGYTGLEITVAEKTYTLQLVPL